MECRVCLRPFDEALRLPRNMQCGHTFCASCLDVIASFKSITCPDCRFVQQHVNGAQSLPVSHGVLEILDLTREELKSSFATMNSLVPSGSRSSSDSVTRLSKHDNLLKILRNIEANVGLLEKMSERRRSVIEWLTRESGACQQEQEDLKRKREKLLVCSQQLDSASKPEEFQLLEFCMSPKPRSLEWYNQQKNLLTVFLKINREGVNNLNHFLRFIPRRRKYLSALLRRLALPTKSQPEFGTDLRHLYFIPY